ncbi:NAD(P)H-dependent oxidoreductase [Yoonia sp. BS5-3]|uniref:NAD(P)H-dependent oxidoreductase n=1 Tax=Yoonia phaeophyticola TaxID=3137369 RepID=A0ABZ2V821_9RHOB
MKTFVLYAHPCADSFNAAVHDTVVGALKARDWDVDDCDLNAEGFAPVLTEAERRGYHDIPQNTGPVQAYVDRLRQAEALVMVFPVWNFGYPAILKGFLDRVFLPDVSFKLEGGGISPGLTNIKRLVACTTYGGTRVRAMMNGDPPRKCVTRAVRYACGWPRTRYIGLYDMNNNSPDALSAHLDRVRSEMQRL